MTLFNSVSEGFTKMKYSRPPGSQPLVAVWNQCHKLIFLSWNRNQCRVTVSSLVNYVCDVTKAYSIIPLVSFGIITGYCKIMRLWKKGNFPGSLFKSTSRDPSGALTCGTCHAVPSCEFHIGKLCDVSTLPILILSVLQRRGHTVGTIILWLLSELGKRLPHSHTWKTHNSLWSTPCQPASCSYLSSVIGSADQQGPMESSDEWVNNSY